MSREKFYDNLKSGWRELRLKYAVDLSSSRIESNSNDFAYVGLENIESGTGRLIPKAENQTNGDGETESSSVVNVFEKGDVLFSKLRPYLAKGFIAKEPGTSTTELLVFKPKENTDNKFLLYTLLSPNFVKFVDSATFGSRMPRADWNFVRDIFVPIPPLDEQRTIAAMLDRETARLDELITEKERLLELLAEKRRALITNAVTRGLDPNAPLVDSGVEWLGEIPQHWKTPPIYARYEIQLGKMLDERRITGTQLGKYLRNVDVQWGKINLENLPEMDFSPEDRKRYNLKFGDILVCEGGEIGRTAIWKENLENCFYQKAIHRLRPRTQEDFPDFFLYVMYALVNLGVFVAMSSASTILHLPAEKLSIVRYASPPLEEQQEIVEYIEAETEKIDRMQAATRETVELLKERRSSLIAAAVTGKISVREMR